MARFFLLYFFTAILASGTVFSQTEPLPPPVVCIGSNCVETPQSTAKAAIINSAIKWHSGTYVGTVYSWCTATYDNDNLSTISDIGTQGNIRGLNVYFFWNCLEGPTAGDYSAGFARIDALLARAAKQTPQKRIMFGVALAEYGSCTSPNLQLPAYIIQQGGYVGCPDTNQFRWVVKFWEPKVMDRLIALSAAYAARYNNHPLFEMYVPFVETADVGPGFTVAAGHREFVRFFGAAAKQWTKTMVRLSLNHWGSDASNRALIEGITAVNPHVAFGPPDTYPEEVRPRRQPGNYNYRGLNTNGTVHSGWSDLRGRYAFVAEVQTPELGAQYGPGGGAAFTLQQIQDWAKNTLRDTHVIWQKNTYYGPIENQWAAEKQFIRAGKSVVYSTSCPRAFSSCDTN